MKGRVEAKTTIPVGGASFTMAVTGLGGTSVRTVAAGVYSPSELLAAVEAELEAGEIALGGATGYSVIGGFGEGGTGRASLIHNSATHFAITAWGSTLLRDWLGFSTTLSGAFSYTGPAACQAVWMAPCDFDRPRGLAAGPLHLDRNVNVAPTGAISALGFGYPTRRKLGRVTWHNVGVTKALEAYETVVGDSFEAWFVNTHGGRVSSLFGMAPLVRFYPDANDNDYTEIRLTEPMRAFDPERVDPMWIGLWPVSIDGFVVPS